MDVLIGFLIAAVLISFLLAVKKLCKSYLGRVCGCVLK